MADDKTGGGGRAGETDNGLRTAADAAASCSAATASLTSVDTGKRAAGRVAPDAGKVFERTRDSKPWPGGFDQKLNSKRTTDTSV